MTYNSIRKYFWKNTKFIKENKKEINSPVATRATIKLSWNLIYARLPFNRTIWRVDLTVQLLINTKTAKTANWNWFLLRVCFTLCWIWKNHWETRIKSTSKTFPIRYCTKGHRSKRDVVLSCSIFLTQFYNSETDSSKL